MKLMNYLNLNNYPVKLSFMKDRSNEFEEVYHAHQGMELLYIHKGHGSVIADGRMVEITPGRLFCFRPFHMHRVKIDISKEPYIRSLFLFEPLILEKYLMPFHSLLKFFRKLWMEPTYQIYFDQIEENKLQSMIEEYEKITANIKPLEKLENDMYFLFKLIHLLKHNTSNNQMSDSLSGFSNKNDSITLILNWLEENFHEEFCLNKLSEAIHLSPNHISYLFHKETGSRITDYLIARRIQEACLLLRTTQLSIQEVGCRVGYSNFSYFCKLFKSKTNVTPNQFKKVHFIH